MATTDQGLRGLALLDAVIEHIEKHPETWNQEHYRCKTGMCVAGWACEMTGGRWIEGPDHDLGDVLVPEPYDSPSSICTYADGRQGVEAPDRAATLLGGSPWSLSDDGGYLFGGDNTLADIRRIRDNLAAGGLS